MKLKELKDLTKKELIEEIKVRDKLIKILTETNEINEKLLELKMFAEETK